MSEVAGIIGQVIKRNREKLSLSQKELAEALNVNPSNISGWEAGSFAPGDDMKVQLCEYFDITLNELFGREKNKPADNGELREENIELFKELSEDRRVEAIRDLRHYIDQAIKSELDRRDQK